MDGAMLLAQDIATGVKLEHGVTASILINPELASSCAPGQGLLRGLEETAGIRAKSVSEYGASGRLLRYALGRTLRGL